MALGIKTAMTSLNLSVQVKSISAPLNDSLETILKPTTVYGPPLIKVFVVEDSPVIRIALAQRLEDDPRFTVVGYAATADEAIAVLTLGLPDVVIVDLHLKQGTGYDVLTYLLSARAPADLKAIVLTNYASPAHRRRALELGASDFFDKSMQFEDMLDGLRVWADKKSPSPPAAAQ
jgi:DNA-binding NarL/FixJ family response regulator